MNSIAKRHMRIWRAPDVKLLCMGKDAFIEICRRRPCQYDLSLLELVSRQSGIMPHQAQEIGHGELVPQYLFNGTGDQAGISAQDGENFWLLIKPMKRTVDHH